MTRKTFGSAFAIAALFAAGLGAQTQPQSTSPAGDDMRQDDARTITVVGCVQQEPGANDDEFILANARPAGSAEAGAVGTSGTMTTPSPATDPSTDPATDPTPDPTRPGEPADVTDQAATQGTVDHSAHMGAKSYELTGDREDDLKNYVGKRVEITGSFEDEAGDIDADRPVAQGAPASQTDPGAPAPSDTVGTSGTTPADATAARAGDDLPRLKVKSVREVSGSCAPAGDEPDRR